MKMILAIVQDEDSHRVMESLVVAGFKSTRLSSTGGFLRSGNTTFLIGTEPDRLPAALDVIRKNCCRRKRVVALSGPIPTALGTELPVTPMEVEIGGATVFVWNVEQTATY